MRHLKWEKTGRLFVDENNPRKYTYKTSVSAKNIDLGNGEYAPYIYDSNKKQITFGDYSFLMASGGIGVYKKEELQFTFGFHPEIYDLGEWKRSASTAGNLSVEEILTDGHTDKLKISYLVDDKDLGAEISFTVSADQMTDFTYNFTNKNDSAIQARVVLDTDIKDQGELVGTNSYVFQGRGFQFKWNHDEIADHITEADENGFRIRLKEGNYEAKESKQLNPTTWGPTNPADVGYEMSGDWDTEDAYNGNLGGSVLHATFSFLYNSTTINKTDTVNSVYFSAEPSGGITLNIAIRLQSGNWAIWSDANKPTAATWANARATGDKTVVYANNYFGSGQTYEVNLGGDLTTAIDADAGDKLENGDYVNICAWSEETTAGDYISWNSAGVSTLTINWTAGGGGGSKVPLIMAQMNQFGGGAR